MAIFRSCFKSFWTGWDLFKQAGLSMKSSFPIPIIPWSACVSLDRSLYTFCACFLICKDKIIVFLPSLPRILLWQHKKQHGKLVWMAKSMITNARKAAYKTLLSLWREYSILAKNYKELSKEQEPDHTVFSVGVLYCPATLRLLEIFHDKRFSWIFIKIITPRR